MDWLQRHPFVSQDSILVDYPTTSRFLLNDRAQRREKQKDGGRGGTPVPPLPPGNRGQESHRPSATSLGKGGLTY